MRDFAAPFASHALRHGGQWKHRFFGVRPEWWFEGAGAQMSPVFRWRAFPLNTAVNPTG